MFVSIMQKKKNSKQSAKLSLNEQEYKPWVIQADVPNGKNPWHLDK